MKDASKNKQPSQYIFIAAEIEIKYVVLYLNTLLNLRTLFTTAFIQTLLSSELGPCVDR